MELKLKPPRASHRDPAQDRAGRPASWGTGTRALPGLQPPSAHREPWTQSPHTPQKQGGPRSWHSAKSLPSTRPEPAKQTTSDILTSIPSDHGVKGLPFQLECSRPLNLQYLPLFYFICNKKRFKIMISVLFHKEK